MENHIRMSTEDARKLFIAGLPETIGEDVLRQLFEATGGMVTEVSIPRDRATGKSRGFGFVTMADSEQAETARGALDGSVQVGRSISVRPFRTEPPSKRPEPSRPAPPPVTPDRTLYIGNLPYDCTDERVEVLLKNLGVQGVARVNLPVGTDGRRRGFGFVNMETGEAAVDAMTKLQTVEMNGRRLVVNIAHPKSERSPRSERFDSVRPMGSVRPGPESGDFEFMPPPPPDAPRRTHEDRKRPKLEADKAKAPGRPKHKERRVSGRRRGGFADEFDDE